MKMLRNFSILGLCVIMLSGCLYNFIVPEQAPPIDPGDPNAPEISFSADIVPIFNNGNKCTSCHKTGGRNPDLTPDNAYASIGNTKYINSASPEESLIYTKPNPDGGHPAKYSEAEAATVLLWINQGAQNN